MNGYWEVSGAWLLHSTLGGGGLLLLAWLLVQWCRQPARRQRLGESGLAAALLLAVLSLGPPWLIIPLLNQARSTDPAPVSPQQSLPPLHGLSLSHETRREALAPPPAGEKKPSRHCVQFPEAVEKKPAKECVQLPEDATLWTTALAALTVREPEREVAADFSRTPTVPSPPNQPEVVREEVEPSDIVALQAPDSEPPAFSFNQLVSWLGLAYAVGAAWFLGRWCLGYLALWRLLRTARPASPAVAELFASMAHEHRRLPRLLVSNRLQVPLSCGLWQPTVLIPTSLCEPADSEALRWVFAHELTHLERRDGWACLLFGLGQAVYFYVPWFWWLRRQVRLCQEYIADAAAAAQAREVEEYAQFLVSLTTAPAVPMGATGVSGNSSDLFRRLSMLLQNPDRVEKRCPGWWGLAATAGLLSIAFFLSGIGLSDAAPLFSSEEDVAALVSNTPHSEPMLNEEDDDDADEDEDQVVSKNQDDDEPADEDKNKDAEKEKKTKKEKVKKSLDNLRSELNKLLENLPAEVDREQIQKEIKKVLEQVQEQLKEGGTVHKEIKKAFEEVQEQFKQGGPAQKELQKALEQAREQFRQGKFHDFEVQIEELAKHGLDQRLFEAEQRVGRPGQGRLGIEVDKPSAALMDQLDLPKDQGLVIRQVHAEAPAAKAGLKVNDILLEADGKPVGNNVRELLKILEGIKANTPFDAVVLRKGKKETIKGISLPEAKKSQRVIVERRGGGEAPFPNVPNFQFRVPGGRGVMTTMFRTDDRFTTRHQEGSLIITITGTVADGKGKVSEIQVQDGNKTDKYDSLDKVPEQYRDKAKNLIEMSEKSSIKIEVKE